MLDYIKIEPDSPIPKYKQIINSFHDAIDEKVFKEGSEDPVY